jgi:hypothetical protein
LTASPQDFIGGAVLDALVGETVAAGRSVATAADNAGVGTLRHYRLATTYLALKFWRLIFVNRKNIANESSPKLIPRPR